MSVRRGVSWGWMRVLCGATAILCVATCSGFADGVDRRGSDAAAAAWADKVMSAEAVFDEWGLADGSLPVFLEASDAGNAAAKRDLGRMYQHGFGNVEPDAEQALRWYEAASLQGDALAASYAGDFYSHLTTANYSENEARFWYAKGIRGGDARSALRMAKLEWAQPATTAGRVDRTHALLVTAARLRHAGGPSDVADVAPGLGESLLDVGEAYRTGAGTAQNERTAAACFALAAANGDGEGSIRLARMYVERPGLPRNPLRAIAILRPAETGFTEVQRKSAAQTYALIGQGEEHGSAAGRDIARQAYLGAARMGDSAPGIALAERYVDGDGVPRDEAEAANELLALNDVASIDGVMNVRVAMQQLVDRMQQEHEEGTPAMLRLEKAMSQPIVVPPRVFPETLAAEPQPAVARAPNLLAPDTVTMGQSFAVNVSLNAIAFDDKTQILAGEQNGGKLLFHLPAGMHTMPISVDLIAPGMTFENGDTNQSTIVLDETQANSTVATFHLKAGSAAAQGTILATLSYQQNFLAQLARTIVVTASGSDVASGETAGGTPPPSPGPVSPADGGTRGSDQMLSPTAHTNHGSSVDGRPVLLDVAPRVLPGPVVDEKPQPLTIDPAAKSTDLTIVETLSGDTLHYTFNSPGLVGVVDADVPNAAALRQRVEQMYAQLESTSKNLSADGPCVGGPAKCADNVQARALVQGIGNDLFRNLAPQQFRDIYKLLTGSHIRLHSISVMTNSPTMPWELMLPEPGTDNFLGLTAAVVRENSASPQLAQPADIPFAGVNIVAPKYDGNMALPAAAGEVRAIETVFPKAHAVAGDGDSVGKLLRGDPMTVIHFTGHWQRVTGTGAAAELAPQTAILLEDESMTPDSLTAFRAQGVAANPFYFFNACDLGRSDAQLDYIDGWAPALMESGASGYLGALYLVGDAAASSFAGHFYTNLHASLTGSGAAMGDVVTLSRRQTWAESYDPTALAYVLYAKPFLRLVPAQGAGN